MHYLEINYPAVFVSTLLQFVLGWLWYGLLFKNSWKGLVGTKPADKTNSPGMVMIMCLAANLILSFVLFHIVVLSHVTSFVDGAFVGVVCGLGFMVPPMFAQDFSESRPFKLFAINAVYWLCAMLISGGIFGVWH